MSESITLANGCFWCSEAVFKRIKGVNAVVSGYANSNVPSPSYEQVSSGTTGAAEAVQVDFDPTIISLDQVLDVFFATHDPTTLNRQGNDVGTQYRSAIIYNSVEQQKAAENKIAQLQSAGKFSSAIVTTIEQLQNFTPAEEEHKEFYDRNRDYAYCRLIIDPKITKLYKDFKNQIKAE